MQVTRRYYAALGLAGVLAVYGLVLDDYMVLAGAIAITGWLITHQVAFVRMLTRLDDTLDIEQSTPDTHARTNDTVSITLTASVATPTALLVTITSIPPVGLTIPPLRDRTLTLPAGEQNATITYHVTCPIAGKYVFDPVRINAVDPVGLFTETLECDAMLSLPVTPRTPRNIHIGEGGDQIVAAYGEHGTGRLGPGIEPTELREYTPRDPAKRIDWKATARLNHPYVHEYEAETDRVTILLVDHSALMSRGPAGETKLDYAREIALGFLNSAHELDDPIGLYTVGDNGITSEQAPTTTPDGYARIRHHLRHLEPTHESPTDQRNPQAKNEADLHRAAAALTHDDSRYATTLRPYFAAAQTYTKHLDDTPLADTVETYLARHGESVWTIVFSDDSNHHELRDTIDRARIGDNHVLAFITPNALFDPDGITDIDTAYTRYRDFEEFRRSLSQLDRVAAFEVGPGDHLNAILTSRRDRKPSPLTRTRSE